MVDSNLGFILWSTGDFNNNVRVFEKHLLVIFDTKWMMLTVEEKFRIMYLFSLLSIMYRNCNRMRSAVNVFNTCLSKVYISLSLQLLQLPYPLIGLLFGSCIE